MAGFLKLAAVAVLALNLGLGPAIAANCESDSSKREVVGATNITPSVRTDIENRFWRESKASVYSKVHLRKGNEEWILYDDATIFEEETLKEGDVLSHRATTKPVSNRQEFSYVVKVRHDHHFLLSCNYKVIFGAKWGQFKAGTCANETAAPDLCEDCVVTCKRDWNRDNFRWKLRFVIENKGQ